MPVLASAEACMGCGCGRCVSVCPVSAITQLEGEYPIFNQGTCINCGECIEACPLGIIVFALW